MDSPQVGGQRANVQAMQGPEGHQTGGVYKSTDGGESWTRINSANPRPMYFSLIRVDPTDASLLFVTWYASGLRVFDIRNPKSPREVAYFNPAVGAGASRTHDWSTSYPRYMKETGQIWFGSRVTGFNVVELDPRLRPHYRGVRVSDAWSVAPPAAPAVATAAARTLAAEPAPALFCTLALTGNS